MSRRRGPATLHEFVAYAVFIVICIVFAVSCNNYRNDQCEAKGGHREYAHAWYDRGKNEQKVCISDDGRLLR